ncbi:MAG: hypothetical protein K8T89_11655 [Planctomycetes bacterium]|nr:hypothetical protein [Planctomycetota bacterium]
MPLTATYTEELVRGIASDEATFEKARKIAAAKRFQNLGVSTDGSWLFGECPGSATEPYILSADFHDPAAPVLRSSSPSRKHPDSFSIALLLAYLQDPSAFGEREPTEDLLIKREKKLAQDEKKKSGSAVPRKITKTAQDKKSSAQREGLELLERFLVDLIAGGKWLDAGNLEKVEKLSKQLGDASLPASVYGLRKLLLIAKQKETTEEDKTFLAAEVIGLLWNTIQRAKAYSANKLLPGETQAEADIFIEDVIGRALQLADLREKGYFQSNLQLFELAFERTDDESRQQRVEISNLLDMSSGAIHQAATHRPFKGLSQVPEQISYEQPFTVPELAVCPGFVNRRLRWEKGSEHIHEHPPADFLAKAHALAQTSFQAALIAFREQLKHALAPREAVFFLRIERIGKIGERVVIQDGTNARIEMKDRRKDYSNVANLVRAAGMMGKDNPALLVRLSVQTSSNLVFGQPLAALTAKHHVRLGL